MTLLGLIRSDLYRYAGIKEPFWPIFRAAWSTQHGFRWTVMFRICEALRSGGREHRGWARQVAFRICQRRLSAMSLRYGFDIPVSVKIGPGFKLGHWGGVVVNAAATIGDNCTVSHGVTIGIVSRGKRKGVPAIGDRVWLGTGSVVVGGVHIGDDALVGPNAVVIESLPPNAICVTAPSRVVSQDPEKGSRGYVLRKWEES